jgi:hypothetical protein
MSNSNLTKAKKAKCDEFYTQYVDIEKELQYYDFEDKIVYCNCDNPQYSNFYKYFKDNFHIHKIKHLYCTGYNKDGNGYFAEYNGIEEIIKSLNDNGDFRNEECINILKIADVIVTNPPFSLFREYVKQLMDYNKQFLVIGSQNAITYKEIFPLFKSNKMWWGTDCVRWFIVTEKMGKTTKISYNGQTIAEGDRSRWFTNIGHKKHNEPLELYRKYDAVAYPKYDNYDAIEVSKTCDIPMDYDGVMGVPITFLDKYCPSQFEIVDINPHFYSIVSQGLPKPKQLKISGKKDPYARILIKRRA